MMSSQWEHFHLSYKSYFFPLGMILSPVKLYKKELMGINTWSTSIIFKIARNMILTKLPLSTSISLRSFHATMDFTTKAS